MTYEEISAMVTDIGNDIVYISDVDTYELRYINATGIEAIKNEEEKEWLGKPCYEVLQNATEPCSFCTNHLLSTDKFYKWEHFNPVVKRHYSVRDKLVSIDGKEMRLEIAMDITEKAIVEQQLRQKLVEEETLIACIQTLQKIENSDLAISRLLEIVADYYVAERAYIFEINYKDEILTNTYEWCKEAVTPQIDNLKALPLHAADRWYEQFKSQGEFYINSLEENVDKNSEEYKILSAQGIEALMAAPLFDNEKLVGFLGVDNPSENTDNMTLMQSVAVFVLDDLNKRAIKEKLIELSFMDALTKVGNRNSYMQELDRLINNSPESLGIVYVDMNGLKEVNDLEGHMQGDKLIVYVADVLRQIFVNKIFRIGGDEFVVICDNLDKKWFVDKITKLRKQVEKDQKLQISIGTSWNIKGTDIMKQIEETDKLMYLDKQRYYSKYVKSSSKHKASLSHKLLSEIEDGCFTVVLQPQTNLKSMKVSSAEALVRKRDRDGVVEFPDQFISKYEQEGIIRHIDFFVLEKVCQLLQYWESAIPELDMRIAVNFSRLTFLENDIANQMATICKVYNVNPNRIVIEVTERIGMIDKDVLTELMESVTSQGFFVSLDDFGSEYSNLSILTEMSFDEVKIDRSLIDNLADNEKSRLVTEHAIVMCKSLGFNVSVGEGVETEEQSKLLQDYDCTLGQGYYFEKPISIEEFEAKYIFNE